MDDMILFGGTQAPQREDLRDKNLMDDRLFAICMQNEKFCKYVLEIILDVEIYSIEMSEIQKTVQNLPGYKSIRLDVYAKTAEGIYNVEMQTTNNDCMPKRARYYQGILDTTSLYAGKKVKYKKLAKTVIIFINDFDVYGLGYYKYSFHRWCDDNKSLVMGDETQHIFLNLNGYDKTGASDELVQFLKYVKNSKSEIAAGSSKLEDLDNFFQILKGSKEVEDKYMDGKWYAEELEEKAINEGIKIYIETLKSYGIERLDIAKQLQDRYNLDPEDAEDYLEEYYDER